MEENNIRCFACNTPSQCIFKRFHRDKRVLLLTFRRPYSIPIFVIYSRREEAPAFEIVQVNSMLIMRLQRNIFPIED